MNLDRSPSARTQIASPPVSFDSLRNAAAVPFPVLPARLLDADLHPVPAIPPAATELCIWTLPNDPSKRVLALKSFPPHFYVELRGRFGEPILYWQVE